MRPIVEGMGLAWSPQFTKLKAAAGRFDLRSHIVTQVGHDQSREMLRIPLRRYPMWLATVNRARRPALAETV